MRILKRHPLLTPVTNYVIDAPTPSNLNYWWNVGSLLGLSLGIQIITGVTLAMHYNPSVLEAFNSVEHIMRDVNNGWLIRYLHANAASAFFFLVYLHVGKGLYYGSYKNPRTLVWVIGTIMLILMMAIAFLGYVLPYGQMSLWGATVITNLLSAIPWIGQDIVEFVWGGFSVNNATLNRFFSLHFVLPFALAGLVLLHLVSLHDSAGSGNPLGISANPDRIPFSPYYTFKDLITVFIFMFVLSAIVFFVPNVLGDSENYVMANPMQTPPAIVPEWYLLPYYAILRSIPNKLFGVIAMFSAILAILTMTFVDVNKLRGMQFKPFTKFVIFVFVTNLLLLLVLGAKHVETPFIEIGQLVTFTYFIYFIVTMPFSTLFESTLSELSENIKNIPNNFVPKKYMLLTSSNPLIYITNYFVFNKKKIIISLLTSIILLILFKFPFSVIGKLLIFDKYIFILIVSVVVSSMLSFIITNLYHDKVSTTRQILLSWIIPLIFCVLFHFILLPLVRPFLIVEVTNFFLIITQFYISIFSTTLVMGSKNITNLTNLEEVKLKGLILAADNSGSKDKGKGKELIKSGESSNTAVGKQRVRTRSRSPQEGFSTVSEYRVRSPINRPVTPAGTVNPQRLMLSKERSPTPAWDIFGFTKALASSAPNTQVTVASSSQNIDLSSTSSELAPTVDDNSSNYSYTPEDILKKDAIYKIDLWKETTNKLHGYFETESKNLKDEINSATDEQWKLLATNYHLLCLQVIALDYGREQNSRAGIENIYPSNIECVNASLSEENNMIRMQNTVKFFDKKLINMNQYMDIIMPGDSNVKSLKDLIYSSDPDDFAKAKEIIGEQYKMVQKTMPFVHNYYNERAVSIYDSYKIIDHYKGLKLGTTKNNLETIVWNNKLSHIIPRSVPMINRLYQNK